MIEKLPIIEKVSTEEYASLSAKPMNSSLCCDRINQIYKIKSNDWESDLQSTINLLHQQSVNNLMYAK